ncbi:MAG: hypothetical protein K5664_00180 [Firmicutes bacterium]|nr:hypothetical protein [Bacillota bacterium]HAL63294.1 hypothetical protein [Clostridiales bacterium]
MKTAKRVLALAVFFSIFFALFSLCDRILSRKEVEGWWNVTAKIDGFYNSPKNEYDVIFFGSSNTYCSFNPLVIWKETGVKSYVFATQQQPLWATYYYMKDAFKRQNPDVAVLDVLMASKNDEYYDDGVNYTFCDNMPFSFDKIALARVSAPKGRRLGLLIRFLKYHSRWNELKKEDFEYRKRDMSDYSKGFYVLTSKCNNAEHTDLKNVEDSLPLSDKNREYLDKIIALCKENDVRLMLLKAPSNSTEEEKRYYNSVAKIAEENGLEFVDYNMCYDEIGLDMATDFFDERHLNIFGAEKFTEYFVKTTEYFKDRECSDNDWQGDYERYVKERDKK